MMKKKLFIGFLMAVGVYGIASGQQATKSQLDKDGWVKIGEATVNLSDEKGIFNWETDREKTINANEKYTAIKFRAIDVPVSLTNVEVEYDNGKKQNLDVNSDIKVNTESKMLTIDSKEDLDKITFNYKKNESAAVDKAKVELWGLKASAPSGMGQGDRNDVNVNEGRDNKMKEDRDTMILQRNK